LYPYQDSEATADLGFKKRVAEEPQRSFNPQVRSHGIEGNNPERKECVMTEYWTNK